VGGSLSPGSPVRWIIHTHAAADSRDSENPRLEHQPKIGSSSIKTCKN